MILSFLDEAFEISATMARFTIVMYDNVYVFTTEEDFVAMVAKFVARSKSTAVVWAKNVVVRLSAML